MAGSMSQRFRSVSGLNEASAVPYKGSPHASSLALLGKKKKVLLFSLY